MTQEIVVVLEDTQPEIVVVLEDASPEIDVTLSEVGLAGPKGDSGDPGADGEVTLETLNAHIDSPTPHPVYDDGPSFLLLYQNAKV